MKPSRLNNALRLITALFFVAVALLLFGRAVGNGFSHDEQQFVAPGLALTQHGQLPYVDYPFLHMPLMPLVYGLAMLLGSNDFLIARLANEAFLFAALVAAFWIILRFSPLRSAFTRHLFGWFAVLYVLVDRSLLTIDGRAMNHTLPVLLAMLMVLVYLRTGQEAQFPKRAMLLGALAALAASTRLNFAVLFAPLALILLFDPLVKSRAMRLRSIGTATAGALAAFLPAIGLFLAAPRQFYYGTILYIRLNTLYRASLDGWDSMSLRHEIDSFFGQIIHTPDSRIVFASMLVVSLVSFALALRGSRRIWFQVFVVESIAVALFLSAFAPTPLFPQYFFAPLPFVLLGLFLTLGNLPRLQEYVAAVPVALLLLLALREPAPWEEISRRFRGLGQPEAWVTTQMENLSRFIVEHAVCEEDCVALTVAPIAPMQAGMQVYPWSYVGPFSWRTAHILAREERQQYGIVSFWDLDEYLEQNPPDLVLTGAEASFDGFVPSDPGGVERPFEEFALEHGFSPIPVSIDHSTIGPPLTLWVK